MCPPGELRRMAARMFGFFARAYLTLARSPPITGPLRIIWSSTAVTSMASDASVHAAAPKAETNPRTYLGNVTACRSPPRPCCGRSLLLELRVGLLEGLAHRRPGLVGAASELQPGVARGRLHLAQLFPGLVLMLTDRGELLLVLRAHARLRLCGLAFPLRHLGVPLIELGLQLRDVFFTLGCHVASLPRNGRKFDPILLRCGQIVTRVPSSTTRSGSSLKYSAVAGLLRCIQRKSSRRQVRSPGRVARAIVDLPRKNVVCMDSSRRPWRSRSLSPRGTSGSSMKP